MTSKKARDKEGIARAYLDFNRTMEEDSYGACDSYKLECSSAVAV